MSAELSPSTTVDERQALRHRVHVLLETPTFRALQGAGMADLMIAVFNAASFAELPSVYQEIIHYAEATRESD